MLWHAVGMPVNCHLKLLVFLGLCWFLWSVSYRVCVFVAVVRPGYTNCWCTGLCQCRKRSLRFATLGRRREFYGTPHNFDCCWIHYFRHRLLWMLWCHPGEPLHDCYSKMHFYIINSYSIHHILENLVHKFGAICVCCRRFCKETVFTKYLPVQNL